MRVFESREDESLFPCWEDQLPVTNGPLVSEWQPELRVEQIEALPLEAFPVIDDFGIAITKPIWTSWRYHSKLFGLAFFSEQKGFFACFAL